MVNSQYEMHGTWIVSGYPISCTQDIKAESDACREMASTVVFKSQHRISTSAHNSRYILKGRLLKYQVEILG